MDEKLQNVPETAGEVPPISVEEIRNQLAMMKGNKACGPDMIPIEVWKKMGEEGIVFLKKELNEMLTSGIPSSWRLSEVTPLFRGKGSILLLLLHLFPLLCGVDVSPSRPVLRVLL